MLPSENGAGVQNNSAKPEFYLIVFNVQKRANIGTMLRSACAFGVKEVLVASGSKKRKKDRMVSLFGAQGTDHHTKIRPVEKFSEAVEYVRSKGCKICGVEIKDEAKDISSHPFTGNTAFVLGNEGQGIDPAHAAQCDFFVYIPHYGSGTASLNVTVAASIVFHHFGVWAKYAERERVGEKFLVAPRKHKTGEDLTAEDLALRAERKAKRQKAAETAEAAASSRECSGSDANQAPSN